MKRQGAMFYFVWPITVPQMAKVIVAAVIGLLLLVLGLGATLEVAFR